MKMLEISRYGSGGVRMDLCYYFSTTRKPELVEVGGKAMSLILMSQQKLPVPPGFVLSVAFFKSWFASIQNMPEWTKVLNSSVEELKMHCQAVQEYCLDLQLDEIQRKALTDALKPFRVNDQLPLFAVRSSSPEEDLEGASFAGGYETFLGVQEAGLLDAIRKSFASCFDERVFVYKKEHEFDLTNPRIAIIIQQQIAAETAGVAFSLNPLNNCYDEAVINANFGVGESVVSGRVTPDLFIINKISRSILEKKIGKKESSVWLAEKGNTYEETSSLNSKLCLTDEQILKLMDLLILIEDYYLKPIDIEWAFKGEDLYLLQARPITAYIPLPDKMLTLPGEPKRLYIDMTLTKQGIHEPFTVMGTAFFDIVQRTFIKNLFGKDLLGIEDGVCFNLEGRSYIQVSNTAKLQGKKMLVNSSRSADPLTAEILEQTDLSEYLPEKLPPRLKGVIFSLIFSSSKSGLKAIRAFHKPENYQKWFLQKIDLVETELSAIKTKNLSLVDFANELVNWYGCFLNDFSMPTLYAAEFARSQIKKLFKDDPVEVGNKIGYLERSLPNNITIEMGLAMFRLASFQELKECSTAEEFIKKLKLRSFSDSFLQAWDEFIKKYSFRCPRELDIATSRPYEQPEAIFHQLHMMALNTDVENNPQVIFKRAKIERENTFKQLYQIAEKKGKRKAKKLAKYYNVLVTLGGYREIHKYYLVMIIDLLRRQILTVTELLLEKGWLDNLEQVFDLTIDDLERGLNDETFDLQAKGKANTPFLNKIKNIREFPRVIDSRGKILLPPKKEAAEGELIGEPISPGIVCGKVKVLHSPDEKPILPGEILVARATDPGWTLLFVNAGGVILEVGGILQHGALVAREYGKPCISAIDNATSLLHDGQLVEIDGTSGIVRIIE